MTINFQGNMDSNLKNLTLSELHTCTQYLDRLFHALGEISDLGPDAEVRKLTSNYHNEIHSILQAEILTKELVQQKLPSSSLKDSKELTQSILRILEGLFFMEVHLPELVKKSVKIMNKMYIYAHQFHVICEEKTDLDIQYPRTYILDMTNDLKIPKFHLDIEQLWEISQKEQSSITNLLWQREKKYDSLLMEGHEHIFNKDYEESLQCFSRALNFQETAEIYTLLGWNYSFLNQNDKAKSYCLKAIQKDPDYGPPYNDLGTYLLNEGQVDESLKWFEMAKKAMNYQNREYPFINSGRAHMAKRDFAKALEEFSKALALAPFHEELHETVEKLKVSLLKTNIEVKDVLGKPSEPPPSVF